MLRAVITVLGAEQEVKFYFDYKLADESNPESTEVFNVRTTQGLKLDRVLSPENREYLESIALEHYHDTEEAFIESLHDYNYSHQKEAA